MLEILVDSTGARVLFDLEKEGGKKMTCQWWTGRAKRVGP